LRFQIFVPKNLAQKPKHSLVRENIAVAPTREIQLGASRQESEAR
jgi:hypothetical protein